MCNSNAIHENRCVDGIAYRKNKNSNWFLFPKYVCSNRNHDHGPDRDGNMEAQETFGWCDRTTYNALWNMNTSKRVSVDCLLPKNWNQ